MTESDERSVEIRPTARVHAIVTDVALREGDSIRLVFRPEIVDNPCDPEACIRGTFIYQRKGRRDAWEDITTDSLNKLKSGEGYKLELKAGELLRLRRELLMLAQYYRKQGIPPSPQRLVRLERRLAELLTLSEQDLNKLLEDNEADALRMVSRTLHMVATSDSFRRFISTVPDRVPELTASLGLASLREAIGFWESEKDNPSEEFWQQALEKRAFLLAQLFHYPILLIRNKAYVGGKRIDNQHGNLVDILAKVRVTGGALIVEIKTPVTPLLGPEYRTDVYPLSREVSGALGQVLHYKGSLQKEISAVREGVDDWLEADEPRCLVIAGNVRSELQTQVKRRSFERLRERLSGVTIVGFDEIFEKARDLLKLMSDGPSQMSLR